MHDEKNIFDHLKTRKIATPDPDYFEQLTQKVVTSQAPKIVPLYKKPVLWLAASAAAIAVVVVVTLGRNPADESPLLALNDLTTDEVFDYVDANIEEFDTEMLIDAVSSDAIETVVIVSKETAFDHTEVAETEINFEDINTDDILDYLDQEEIDLYDLEDESFI